LASAELYDSATATWASTGLLNLGRYSHTATVLISGKVLVVGGYMTFSYIPLATAELYDSAAPALARWSPSPVELLLLP
jgi:hypothetical protein